MPMVTSDGHVCVLGTREGKSHHLSCVFIRFDVSCLMLAETEFVLVHTAK